MSYRNIQIIYLIFNELFGFYRNFESLKLKKIFFVAVLGVCCCPGFSLVARSGGYSVVVMCRLLIVVASLLVGHGL